MRLALLALLFALSVAAQPATTQITDTVYDHSGNRFTGSLTVTLSTKGGTQNGSPVLSPVTRVSITAGALSLKLVPNDTMTPAQTSYIFTFSNGDTRTCTIPTSGSPITLANHCTEAAPANPTPSIPLAWLDVSGLSAGQYCASVSSSHVLTLTQGSCPGSGGGGGFYQTVEMNTTPVTQRSNLNFSPNFSLSDSSGSDRTTVELADPISVATSSTAANLSGTPALPNGTTATTQSAADNSTKLATTAYVDTGLAGKENSFTILPEASGGTGANNVPGSAGHVLRSNGTHYVDGAIQAADVPTLNQNTSGTAANLSGTPALPNGTTATTQSQADGSTKLATTAYVDTGLAGKENSFTVLPESAGGTGANNMVGSAGHVLRSDGTHYVDGAIQAADVPTLNQNTTGTAANVTGVVARANGGLNSNSAGMGILRDGSTPSASELSGDAATSGSNAVKVQGINSVPLCTGFSPTTSQFLQYTTGSSPNPCWTAAAASSGLSLQTIQQTIAYTSVTAASGGMNLNLGSSLPAKAKVIGVNLNITTPFTSGSITGMTISVGISGEETEWMTPQIAIGTGTITQIDAGGFWNDTLSSVQAVAKFLSTAGGNLGNGSTTNLTAGSATVTLVYLVIP